MELLYFIIFVVVVGVIAFLHRSSHLKGFREHLSTGDLAQVKINGTMYDIEVEDVIGSIVYCVVYDDIEIKFNQQFHITDIYPKIHF